MFTSLWLSFLFGTTTPQWDEVKATTTAEKITYYAEQAGVDNQLALRIASCESGLKQYADNGEPLKGKINPQDIGLFQINEKYHLEASKKLGLDIYNEDGNIRYAIKIMKESGVNPWNWSKSCWSKAGLK